MIRYPLGENIVIGERNSQNNVKIFKSLLAGPFDKILDLKP
jgi:hypothetical protein